MKLPHAVITKSPGLLPMLYTVKELAAALDVPERTLRDWLNAGAPHQRDTRNHIWINGTSFQAWVQAQRKVRSAVKLQDHQAYCLRCRKVVALNTPELKPIKGKLIHIKGTCPDCGSTINRGTRYGTTGQPNQLSAGQ